MRAHVTPTLVRELLRRHGLRAGRRLGQHFLVDPNTVRRIVRLAEVGPDETVLEVGPGLGSLTVALADAAARVVCVELDPKVADALREVIGDAGNVEVTVGDALAVDLRALCGGFARLVANLPYETATPILMRVLDDVPEVTGGLVMAQKEVGLRWTAKPGTPHYSGTTVHVAFHADARIVGDVPPTVFLPPPKVASVLVSFTRHPRGAAGVIDRAAFFRFVRDAFGHRRKTLRNALVAAGRDRAAVERAIASSGFDPRVRPERLSIDELARVQLALDAA